MLTEHRSGQTDRASRWHALAVQATVLALLTAMAAVGAMLLTIH